MMILAGRPGSSKHAKGKGKGEGREDDLAKVMSASSANRIDLVHLEEVADEATPKLNKKQKFRRHCARFWCCYLLGAVVLLAIGLPILYESPVERPMTLAFSLTSFRFLVIVPALAQRIVDDTDLPIYRGTLVAVSDNSVRIGIETALTVPGGLSVKLDPLELWLYNKETPGFQPWSMVPLDGQTVSGRTEINVEGQVVGVGNRSELHTFLSGMLYNRTAEISAKGNTTAHLGALNFNVHLDKTVEVDALRELDGFSLDNSQLIIPPREDGINLVGNLTLPNWSILTIGLGNLTFNAWAGDVLIGNLALYDVLLEPGNSTLPFEGELYFETVFEHLVDILGSQSASLSSGSLEVGISGNTTKVDGEHITYLENVLNEAHVLGRTPIIQLLTDFLAGVRDGAIEFDGILDLLSDSVGPLLDDLLGGGGGDDEEGGGGGDDSGIPFRDIFDNLLDDLDENQDPNEETSNPISDLLDGLGMRSKAAKRRVKRALKESRK